MSIVSKTKNSVRFQHQMHGIRYSRSFKTYGLTKAEINKLHSDWIVEVESGKFAKKRYTLLDYSKKWLENYVETVCRPRVVKNYKTQLKNHILPKFGHVFLDSITPAMIDDYVYELKHTKSLANPDEYLSVGTIKKIYAVFKNLLSTAYRNDLVPVNPFSKVRLSFSDMQAQQQIHYWDNIEYKKAISLLSKEQSDNRYVVEFALKTGLRLSEIFGLDWKDLDFASNTIDINKSRQKCNNIMQVLPVKTGSSKRRITMPQSVKDMLLEYRKMHIDNEYVFSNLDPDAATKWFRDFIRRSGLTKIRFHDLRHTHATLLLYQGVDLKTISKRLGHSNIGITMNTYTHVVEDLDRKASEAIDAV